MDNNIIWSGGYDSTALLLSKLLDGNIYVVISFHCSAVTNADEDRTAREKIKKYLFEIPELNFIFEEIEVKGNLGGHQAMIWPGLSMSGVSSGSKTPYNIHFGYIRGDDFWHGSSEIKDIYKSYSKLLDAVIVPVFPFEWSYKRDLVYLYSKHPKVFEMISWAGDTEVVKLKEKEELGQIMEQIRFSMSHVYPDVCFSGEQLKFEFESVEDVAKLALEYCK